LSRLEILANQVAKPSKYAASAWDYFHFDDFLSPEEQKTRLRVREFCEKEVIPLVPKYIETAEFPTELIPKLRTLNIAGLYLTGYGCQGLSFLGAAAVISEFFRADASVGTFMLVHGGLGMSTIWKLGSEEQKKKYLPKLANLDLLIAWGLTEPEYGSDASGLQTSAKKIEGGYLINGRKRWIGNATQADLIIIWARNTKSKEVEGFILEKGMKGLRTEKIQGKFALRSVQNADIYMDDVFVPEENKLPVATKFSNGTAVILASSRIFVTWAATGVVAGAYDSAIKYVRERKQFGKPVGSFQLVQEKMARLLANYQAMTLLVKRCSELYLAGKMTPGHAAMSKAWVTYMGRESVRLAREVMGGNGILVENQTMKALLDMEALYTYEGTYDINMLIAGRDITGFAAFS